MTNNIVARAVLDILNRTHQPLIYMLGCTDVGKTHTVTEIANMCCALGLEVAIIDADVGQSDIGPPCCIGMGMCKRDGQIGKLYDIPASRLYFAGDTSPASCIGACLRGIAAAVHDARALSPDIIIVDSTGWVEGEEACNFKLREIACVRPALIIAIERYSELGGIIQRLTVPGNLLMLRVDEHVVLRTREERRRMRTTSYRRYFRNARLRAFASAIIEGEPEAGALVGLFGDDANNGACLGLGILRSVRSVEIFTPVEEPVRRIIPARIKLTERYEERRRNEH